MQILSGLQVLWPDPEAATQAGWFPPRGTEPPSPPLELPRGGGAQAPSSGLAGTEDSPKSRRRPRGKGHDGATRANVIGTGRPLTPAGTPRHWPPAFRARFHPAGGFASGLAGVKCSKQAVPHDSRGARVQGALNS